MKMTAKIKVLLHSLAAAVLMTALIVLLVLTAFKSGLQIDLTEQRLFTLSEDSEKILSGLKEEVKIAVVSETDREEPMVKALLKEYKKASDAVLVSYIDPEKDPSSLAAYDLGDVAAVYNGSVIVEGKNRTKIISGDALFDYTPEGNYFYGEREITGAVRYVTAEELPVVYFVTGHGEVDAGAYLQQAVSDLSRYAYRVKSLVLLQQDIPEDARVLIMVSPLEDLIDEELEKLRDYLESGGSLFLMANPLMTSNEKVLSNLNGLVNEYGIDISNNYVVEENSTYYLTDNNTCLIPRYGSHEITLPIGESQKMAVFPLARGLGAVDYDKDAVTRDILLLTSDKAWARNDMRNISSGRTGSDIKGPIPLGFAAIKSNASNRERSSRLVVIGDSDYMTDSNYKLQANSSLFIRCVDWLSGERETDSMLGKLINSEKLIVNGQDFIRLVIICCAVLPMICFAAAFLWWKLGRGG